MSQSATALMAEFEAGAKSAELAEQQLRRKMGEEIAQLARQRAFAFRRARLVRAIAAVRDPEPEAAAGLHRDVVTRELGWSGTSANEIAILDRLRPVCTAIWHCACDTEEATASAVRTELEAFEAWFEEAHGKSFYALFDQYVSEVPVVDF